MARVKPTDETAEPAPPASGELAKLANAKRTKVCIITGPRTLVCEPELDWDAADWSRRTYVRPAFRHLANCKVCVETLDQQQ